MPLDAATFTRAIRFAAEESARLAPFLDDLDGWGNGDCDTGTNARATLSAIATELESAVPPSFPETLEAAVDAGLRGGVGHVGILITGLLAAWSHGLGDTTGEPTPVQVRRMLCTLPHQADVHMKLSPAVTEVLREAISEIEAYGATVPELEHVVTRFSSMAHFGLVSATPAGGGRIDPGAAVITVILGCLDAALRADAALLQDLTKMLAELAARGEDPAPRPARPQVGRDFAVDVILQGMDEDAAALRATLDALGARFSAVGRTDFFGIGMWRFHIDTSAPLAVRPRRGRVLRFQVVDSRPDEMIGEDTLSDGVTHRGIRLLERRPRRRVERATVITCTRAPGLVEDLARAGALVLLDPDPEDRGLLVRAGLTSSTGVTMFVPCDEVAVRLGAWAASRIEGLGERMIVADSRDELTAQVLTRACAPVFVPRPGGREAADLLVAVLTEAAAGALASSKVVALPEGPAEEVLTQALKELQTRDVRQMRLLLSAGTDELLAPALRQMTSSVWWGDLWPVSYFESRKSWAAATQGDMVEIIDGRGPGPALLQRLT